MKKKMTHSIKIPQVLIEQKQYLKNQLLVIELLENGFVPPDGLIDNYIFWQQKLIASSLKIAFNAENKTQEQPPTLERYYSEKEI